MQQEKRPQDEAVERMCKDVFVKHLTEIGYGVEIVTDKRQFKGIDLVVQAKSTRATIDEKAKYDNFTEHTPIGFEVVRTIASGDREVGWLFDQNSQTDIYAFHIPKLSQSKDKVLSMKTWLVRADEVKAFIQQRISIEDAFDKAQWLFDNAYSMSIFDFKVNDIKIVLTPHWRKWEQPVNITLTPDQLRSLPHFKEVRYDLGI